MKLIIIYHKLFIFNQQKYKSISGLRNILNDYEPDLVYVTIPGLKHL